MNLSKHEHQQYTHTQKSCNWLDDRNVFKRQGRIHNKAWSVHMDTHTHRHMWEHTQRHMATHTHTVPLPGHFALERAEKLMRVQSFITLETERETRGRVKRARVIQCPPCATCYGCHGNPHLTVGTDSWVSQAARILSGLEHNAINARAI